MDHIHHRLTGTSVQFQTPNPPLISFNQAAAIYIEHGGDDRYLPRIIDHFHGRAITSVFPFDIYQMAEKLYPNSIAATRNRQALTPARAVMIHGYERGWCSYIKLRRFRQDPPTRKSPAAPVWLHAFIRQGERGTHFLPFDKREIARYPCT